MAFTKLEPKSVNTSATFTFANVNITGNLDVTQGINLGPVGNVSISGGTAGQVLSTDGTGNLSWADGGVGGGQIVTGFTGITKDTFTADGSTVNFTLSVTPDNRDYVSVNIDGITQQDAAYNVNDNVITFTGTPLNGEVIEVTTYLAHGLTVAGSNTQVQYNNNGNTGASPNFTFNSSTGVLQASFLKGDGYQIGNIRAANIYGEIPSSHMAGTVFMNAQPNITSVGTLTDLNVTGNVTAAKFIGDGSGLTGVTAGVAAPAGANTQVQFNDNGTTAGNSALTFNKTTGTLSATKFVGDGSLLTGVVSDLTGYATQTYVNTQISNLVDAAPTTLNTLNELAAALGDDANFSTTVTNTLANKLNSNAFTYANITGKPTLSTVATSGSYNDLLNKPTLFDGTYANLTGKPTLFDGTYANLTGKPTLATVATSGSYNDLTNKPTIFSGSYTDLTNKPTLFDGTYANLTGKPTLSTVATSGSYNDLTSKPTLFDGTYANLTGKPTLFSGSYTDLTNKPTLFDGTYANLTGKPTIPTDVSNLTDTNNLLGAGALSQLDDVVLNINTLTTGQVLKYDGTNWVNATDATSGTGGGGGVTSYIDLTDKPFIPYDVSELTDTTNLLISSYNDLTDKPVLGTAAATDATAYATAAQGSKADTALQAADLIGYATESYVTSAISAIPPTDLTGYATESYVTSAISDIPPTDLTNYTTKTYVDSAIAAIPGTDLTGYATETYVTSAIAAIPGTDLTGYATQLYVDNAISAIPTTDLTGYATESFVTSQGYLTSSSLTNYTTKTYVDSAIAAIPGADLTGYATETFVTTRGYLTSTDLTGYATENYVDTAIASVPGADLTGYATETYVNTQISNLVDTAPAALNTLNELAAALGDDPNFATTIATSIGTKLATADFSTTANTWLGTKTTSNLAEGTNLYYTVARANSAINTRVNKAFVDALGVTAATVSTNAQPNITSVGVLTGLTVSGLVTTTGTGIKTGNILDTSGTLAITTHYNNEPGSVGMTANLNVTDTVTAANFVGNGSQLTGMYSNTNVSSFLPTYTGVVKAGSIKTDNLLYANGDPWTLGGGTATGDGSSLFDLNAANVTGTFNSLNVLDAGNINIGGGTAGQLLTVDEVGNLLWIDPQQGGSGGSYLINGNSNIYIQPNSDISFAVAGLADTLVMSTTTMTYTGNIVSGSGTGGNIAGANVITANTVISLQLQGNGSSISDINAANVTGQVSNALVSGTVYTNAQPNITSVGTLVDLAVTGNVTAGHLKGEAGNISNVNGANVYGTVGTATNAGTVTTGAQPNITSTGTLSNLTVSGNVNVSGANISLGTAANLHILGGQPGYALTTDGTGNLGWSAISGTSGGTAISKNYYWQGTVQVNTGTQRLYMPSAGTLTKFYMNLGTAGTTDTSISIKKNGTEIRTATLTSGVASLMTIAGDSLAANDYLTVDITVAGASAVDLYVTFLLTI